MVIAFLFLVMVGLILFAHHLNGKVEYPTDPAAQQRLHTLGDLRVAFAGAYHGWGFHEDGIRSAREVVDAIEALPVDAPSLRHAEAVNA